MESVLFPIVSKINEYLSNYILIFLLVGGSRLAWRLFLNHPLGERLKRRQKPMLIGLLISLIFLHGNDDFHRRLAVRVNVFVRVEVLRKRENFRDKRL